MLDKFATEYEEAITNQLEDFKTIVGEGLSTANSNLSSINDYMSNVSSANGYTEQYSGLFDVNTGSISANVNTAVDKVITAIEDSAKEAKKKQEEEEAAARQAEIAAQEKAAQEAAAQKAAQAQQAQAQLEQIQSQSGIKGVSTATTFAVEDNTDWQAIKEKVEAVFANSNYYAKGKKSKASDYETKINQYLFEKNGKVLSTAGLKQLRTIFNTTNDGIYNAMTALHKKVGNIKNVGGFKTGGIAELIKAQGEDGLALVRNCEGFIAPEHVDAIKGLINNLPQFNYIADSIVKLPSIPVRDMGNTVEYGNVSFNIEMNGGNDTKTFAKEFEKAFKSEKIVPKLIQSASIDRLGNNTRLGSRSIK